MSTQSSGLRLFWTEFRDNKVALLALVVVILMILLCRYGPVCLELWAEAGHSPYFALSPISSLFW